MLIRMVSIVAMLTINPLMVAAVSLGRVDVASHLDEAFFAEIPLNLDSDESLSSIFVDLASPVEYRFLEVYRDHTIDLLRTTIKQDKRGLRVEISSAKAIRAPYINLVLRIRHGRATHFKKFPIFLALPSVATPKVEPLRSVAVASNSTAKPVAVESAAAADAATTGEGSSAGFKPFSGWARTNRYGPMVYGDTLFTVARRLRIDTRYSVRQVAMALFNKNRAQFGQGNINLIKEGSYLETPTASEVEMLSRAEANAAMAVQLKAWKRLKQQPKFARLAEAQKNRYSKRVRVGSQAEGLRHVAAAATSAATATSTKRVAGGVSSDGSAQTVATASVVAERGSPTASLMETASPP
ncbi:MAG: FimV/HubP family polar landmark protein, partial [Mariprofundales bacterium]|nr:FimV/HubP family polar landmark protein [Mariprofundales bacterium]